MSKEQFIRELKENLKKLEQEELDEVLAYYEEYFIEAGEQQALKELPSPSLIAKQILAENVIKKAEAKNSTVKTKVSSIWILLMTIFASPIIFPLAIVFFVFVICLGIFFFIFLVLGFTLTICGIAIAISLFKIAWINPYIILMMLGIGLFLFGAGLLSMLLGYLLLRKMLDAILKKLSRRIQIRKKGEEQ